jgi:hypothetical protein
VRTAFPDSTPIVEGEIGTGGSALNSVLNFNTSYAYDATVQSAYATAFTNAGRETNLVYQYGAVDAILSAITSVGKLNVKTAKGYSIVPIQKYLGNRGMLATNIATVSNGNSRQLVSALFPVVLSSSGNEFANLALLSSFLENTVVQSNMFLTNPAIWLVAAQGLNTQPIIPATRPAQLSAYTKTGYTVRLQDKESFSLWQQYCVDLATDGSAVNVAIKKGLSAPKRMGEYENSVTAVRISEHEANGVAQSALVDTAINSQFTYGSAGMSVADIRKSALESEAIGVPTQDIAALNAMEQSSSLRSGDDSTADAFYSMGKGVWKGLKTMVPIGIDALKLGAMFI